MKISNAFPSKYLKASDLKKPDGTPTAPTVNIGQVKMETFQSGEQGCVMYFQGKEKGLSLNKTKSTVISSAYGDETDLWVGKPVTLSVGTTLFQGRQFDIINVSIPSGPPQAAPEPTAMQEQRNMGCSDEPADELPEGW